MSKSGVCLSIIIPVWNVSKYLPKCLDSILKQKSDDFELILVNDGSVDNSGQICDEYAKKYPKIVTAIHQKNGGPTMARRAGMKKSTGRYIWFVDSDDWITDDALAIIMPELDAKPDIVTFDIEYFYGDKGVKVNQKIAAGHYDRKQLISDVFPTMIYSGRFFYYGIFPAMANKVFSRQLVEKFLDTVSPKIITGEDGLMTYTSLLSASKVVALTGQHLYCYRNENTSQSRSYNPGQYDGLIELNRAMLKLAKSVTDFDITPQINMFFLYDIKFTLENEFSYRHKTTVQERKKRMQKILDYSGTQPQIQSIDRAALPHAARLLRNAILAENLRRITIAVRLILIRKKIHRFI